MYMGNPPYRGRGGYTMQSHDNRQLTGPPRQPYFGQRGSTQMPPQMPLPPQMHSMGTPPPPHLPPTQSRYDHMEQPSRNPYGSQPQMSWTPRLGTPNACSNLIASQLPITPQISPSTSSAADDPFQYRGPQPKSMAEDDDYYRNRYYGGLHGGSYANNVQQSCRYETSNSRPPVKSILKNKSNEHSDNFSGYMTEANNSSVPLPVLPNSGFRNVDEEEDYLYGQKQEEERASQNSVRPERPSSQEEPLPRPPSNPVDSFANRRNQWEEDHDVGFVTSKPRYELADRSISPVRPSEHATTIDNSNAFNETSTLRQYNTEDDSGKGGSRSETCRDNMSHERNHYRSRDRSRSPSPPRYRSSSTSLRRSRSNTPESSQRKFRRIDSPPPDLSPRKREMDESAARYGIENRMTSFQEPDRPMGGIMDHPEFGVGERYDASRMKPDMRDYSADEPQYSSACNTVAIRQLPKIPRIEGSAPRPAAPLSPQAHPAEPSKPQEAEPSENDEAEVASLSEKREQLYKKLNSLKGLLERTIKKEGDLLRNKSRTVGRDPQVIENQKLQADVRKKIEDVHNEVCAVEKQLNRLTGKNVMVEALPEPVAAQSAGSNNLGLPAPVDHDEDEIDCRFEYLDPGSHWCTQCDDLLPKMNNYFDHLHTSSHWKKMDTESAEPWKPKTAKPKIPIENPIQTPVKGVQFLVPVKGFYCNLCAVFLGNNAHAEEHIKTPKHNRAYTRFTLLNPNYEHKWNSDKGKALSRQQKEERKRQKEKEEKEERERRRKHEEEMKKKDKALNDRINEERRNTKRVKELDEDTRSSRNDSSSVARSIKMNLLDRNKDKPKYGYSGKYNSYKDKNKESEKEQERRSRRSQSSDSSSSSSRESSPVAGPSCQSTEFPLKDRKLAMKTCVVISQKDIQRAFKARLRETMKDQRRAAKAALSKNVAAPGPSSMSEEANFSILPSANPPADDFDLEGDDFLACISKKCADFDSANEDNFGETISSAKPELPQSNEQEDDKAIQAADESETVFKTKGAMKEYEVVDNPEMVEADTKDVDCEEPEKTFNGYNDPEPVESEDADPKQSEEPVSSEEQENMPIASNCDEETLSLKGDESSKMEIDTSFENHFGMEEEDNTNKQPSVDLEEAAGISLHEDDDDAKDKEKSSQLFPTLDLNDLAKSPPYTENFSNSEDLLPNLHYNN